MDIVGQEEHKLTVSRYPETFPLKTTTSVDVAEALFSRVGFPEEILTEANKTWDNTCLSNCPINFSNMCLMVLLRRSTIPSVCGW